MTRRFPPLFSPFSISQMDRRNNGATDDIGPNGPVASCAALRLDTFQLLNGQLTGQH
jgi:hypothetical protein